MNKISMDGRDLDVSALAEDALLQIVSVVDAGCARSEERTRSPSEAGRSHGKRLLRMQLTDGTSQCGAFEYVSLGAVDPLNLTKGAKLVAKRGTRRVGGMLLLEPELTELRGGHTLVQRAEETVSKERYAPRFVPLPPVLPSTKPQAPSLQPHGRNLAPTSEPPVAPAPAAHGHRAPTHIIHVEEPVQPPARHNQMASAPASAVHATKPSPKPKPKPKLDPNPSPAADASGALDPGLVADLLAAGLSLEEIHSQLGLPPPGAQSVPPQARAAAGADCATPRRVAGRMGGHGGGRSAR